MIHDVHINKSFNDFLNKYEKIILKIFDIVKSFKKHIPNTYKYSLEYPPLRSNFKYTDKLFIGCILYITLYNSSWTAFIGPIPGKQVHKRFKEYCLNGCFETLFNTSIKNYLCTNQLDKNNKNIISVDTSNIHNRNCYEIKSKNPYMKNKKCVKVSSFVDSKGTPLHLSINESITHDSKIFINDFNKISKNDTLKRKFHRNTLILADKGYDTKSVRNIINESKMKHIIPYNKRNTKDKTKIKELSLDEKKIYRNRIKVEHYFGIIKKYPKINVIYEKLLTSYYNILLLVSSMILINKT